MTPTEALVLAVEAAGDPENIEYEARIVRGLRSFGFTVAPVAAQLDAAVAPLDGDVQRRCWTISETGQCWFYNGHVGPHWLGGEDYAARYGLRPDVAVALLRELVEAGDAPWLTNEHYPRYAAAMEQARAYLELTPSATSRGQIRGQPTPEPNERSTK